MMRALLVSLFVLPVTAMAEDGNLTGDVALNGSRTTGNTDTTDIGAAVKLEWTTGRWEQDLRAIADFGRQNGTTNKQRYRIGYTVSREFAGRFYAYGNADHFQDEFGAYKYGYFLGGGAGWHALAGETRRWDVEAGPGYRRQKTREPINVGPPSIIEESFAARAHSDFEWDLNANVSVFNLSEIVVSSDDTYVWNDVGLTADMFENLAARVSFRVDHHTSVPEGRENTDTVTRVGVVYTFE